MTPLEIPGLICPMGGNCPNPKACFYRCRRERKKGGGMTIDEITKALKARWAQAAAPLDRCGVCGAEASEEDLGHPLTFYDEERGFVARICDDCVMKRGGE